MSISAAVAELNKEIASLDKAITESERTKARLVSHRDALLKEERGVVVTKGKPGRKPGRPAKTVAAVKQTSGSKKVASAKKVVPATKTAAPKKRTMSPEARKKIGDAAKKRWAAKQAAKSE